MEIATCLLGACYDSAHQKSSFEECSVAVSSFTWEKSLKWDEEESLISYFNPVLQHAKPLKQLPLVGPLFTPPVNVTAVVKVAVRAATDPVFPPGIVDVYGILRYSQQQRAT
ncbi:hypothetical protein NC653_017915 [Populus alba x Populus x berolinensis]|uniref:Uncharacterized protein n=1 Tax=Populus alba x Populus x berolinensis TaxID=444605 RepID=A0AAD6QRU6_9ROSI|nr:hypothetical protein NC653_017915 [Populus alba x Populus x berolinensis]